MKIKIKLFASLKEMGGFDEKDLLVSEDITVSDVLNELFKSRHSSNLPSDSFLFAINEEYCTGDKKLSDNDVLAIFPPVSGG